MIPEFYENDQYIGGSIQKCLENQYQNISQNAKHMLKDPAQHITPAKEIHMVSQ